MGGNALKSLNLEARRIPAEEFHALSKKIVGDFRGQFPEVRIEIIPAYAEKPDFGDLDVLVEREGLELAGGIDALEAWVRLAGFSRGQFRNNATTSVEWRDGKDQEVGFQVDFITAPATEFDATLTYFSYNDLGNLMGRIAHKMGMIYGHAGMLYPMRDGTHEFDRVLVCDRPAESMAFLGYDPARFMQGFNSLEDIYAFVVSTPYFNRDIFLLENRNHASRVRDRKRKTYSGFLDWIAERPHLPAFDFPEDKSSWLPLIKDAFPEFAVAHQKSMDALASRQFVSRHFNGGIVSERTGVTGERLSHVMRYIREKMSFEEIERCLRANGIEGMHEIIDEAAQRAGRSPRP